MANDDFIRMSTKSWHYRLMRYVLRRNVPDPKRMSNLCPYFWLLVFCMFIGGPLKLIGQVLWNVFYYAVLWLPTSLITSWVDKATSRWLSEWDKERAYTVFNDGADHKPLGVKSGYRDLMESLHDWVLDNYGVDIHTTSGIKRWNEISADIRERENQRMADIRARRILKNQKKERRMAAAVKRRELWQRRMAPINERFRSIGAGIRKSLTFDTAGIIRWTKRIVGTVVTLGIFVAAYFAVSAINHIIVLIIALWDWTVFWNIMEWIGIGLLTIVGMGLAYVVIRTIWDWLVPVFNKIKSIDQMPWWLRLPGILFKMVGLYVIFYPIKYIVYYPFLYFLCYILIFRGLIMWAIVGGAKFMWKALVGFTGIFGDYFGAAYKGYCPGIEWVDEPDNR